MPLSEQFLTPFERTALEAALRRLDYLERANELGRVGLAPDVALIDAFVDWHRGSLHAASVIAAATLSPAALVDAANEAIALNDPTT